MKKNRIHVFFWELGLSLTPLADAFLIYALVIFVGFLPAAWIFLHSRELSYFAMPLQIGHLSLLYCAGKYLNYRKELLEMRAAIQDDELFFSLYPFEKYLYDRKKAREARRAKREAARAVKRREREYARRGL